LLDSIGGVLIATGVLSALILALFFPEVEDPWPEKIGFDFLFQAAGAGGVVLGVLFAKASESRRNQAIRWGGLWGFRIAVGLYVLSLLNQLISHL
jgi:4-amino-4-deoxy-L-arabinose transferase-like glycosyltransferase